VNERCAASAQPTFGRAPLHFVLVLLLLLVIARSDHERDYEQEHEVHDPAII
jgi:hypothetical protein